MGIVEACLLSLLLFALLGQRELSTEARVSHHLPTAEDVLPSFNLSEKTLRAIDDRRAYLEPLLREVAGVYEESNWSRLRTHARPAEPLPSAERASSSSSSSSSSLPQQTHTLSEEQVAETLFSTVFMTVASFVSAEDTAHYLVYLKNTLCFLRHYQIKLLVFVAHPHFESLEKDLRELRALGAHIARYPVDLFFQLVAEKTTAVKKGRAHADFTASHPSFKSHGALVMLVPILEVLAMGKHVIFMDVDIGLVQDPVPYLLHNNVDFVLSQEPRKCQEFYSTSFPQFFHYQTLEPNTGTMFVRASAAGVRAFHHWMHLIVQDNVMNDQKVFDRRLLRLQYVHNCVSSAQSFREREKEEKGAFCFLNEVLFQNGLIGMQCPQKWNFRDDWLWEMHRYGVRDEDNPNTRFPVTLHANYCNGKSKELAKRGLWLLNEHALHTNQVDLVCKPFNRSATHYALDFNWEREIHEIETRRQREFEELSQRRGKVVVKALGSQAVYFLDDSLVRHWIPNASVFVSHFGENWGLVTTIPFRTMMNLSMGEPLSFKTENNDGDFNV